ncbi:hypothetical protein I79_009649 [Cricetulus griseus]|uniref:Uncharacterized protein n=1 Tax=Cricetulus griseus TaxID=10029 RepID=G3HGC5_CRIGR|nr:hypothetical protein I79_009649 [Cricetulus griseus]
MLCGGLDTCFFGNLDFQVYPSDFMKSLLSAGRIVAKSAPTINTFVNSDWKPAENNTSYSPV